MTKGHTGQTKEDVPRLPTVVETKARTLLQKVMNGM